MPKDGHSFVNSKPIDGPMEGNRDIVKGATKQVSTSSNNCANSESDSVVLFGDNDEAVQSFLSYVSKVGLEQSFSTHKVHTNYWVMLTQFGSEDLCIPDGGADSHVGGRTWLPLTPLSGPTVKFVNVIGFDEASAKKSGLPIIGAVTKTTTDQGKCSYCVQSTISTIHPVHTPSCSLIK